MSPSSNRIVTLNDIEEGNVRSRQDIENDQNNTLTSGAASLDTARKVAHIPSLPNANYAQDLLHRVVREFEPIIRQRKYNVKSVSEMCCCGDGLDYDTTTGKRRSGRKRRIMGRNILGYNQSTSWNRGSSMAHTIHLRMRHVANHARFMQYQDVAGTMAHELAHCEHGPHNEAFYKVMDEILEQHAMLMASKLTTNNGNASIPVFHGHGQAVGGASDGSNIADTRRQQQQQLLAGCKLGGDNTFTQWMTPREAAAAAAEARMRQQQLRLRGDACCRPCVIEIDDDDDTGNNDDEKEASHVGDEKYNDSVGNTKRSTQKKTNNDSAREHGKRVKHTNEVIDLTCDNAATARVKATPTTTNKVLQASDFDSNNSSWPCTYCTYINTPLALMCSVCCEEKVQ